MNGSKIIADTNIVLYLLNGDRTLAESLNNKQVYLSFITELELLSYPGIRNGEKKKIKSFLSNCTIIDVNSSIKEIAVQIRLNTKVKLPDAIIAATSIFLDVPLISSDKDLRKIKELPLIYFEK